MSKKKTHQETFIGKVTEGKDSVIINEKRGDTTHLVDIGEFVSNIVLPFTKSNREVKLVIDISVEEI